MSRFLRHICASTLGRKYIMALTGLLLGSFLAVHAAGNSLIFQSPEALSAYAEHLHSFSLLLHSFSLLLLAVLLVHIATGISLFLRSRRAKGRSCAVSASAGGQTWASRTMLFTGLANLAFLLLHLATVRFADQALPTAERISRTLTSPLLAALYTVGIAALALHISHGFWSTLQSLGISHSRWNGLLRTCAGCSAALISTVFAAIILLHVQAGR
ncbi:succinate dehydrogenase cytochrome b subunit [Candidatus Electronema sp. TJ]|uniref:succinate dehydrogenase cytochrome b subunit n=1 Tax=Candidatus Electronema sp. TJ TaxID=3401573 RepID=UPI003AA8E4C2